jgi:hypothetical protein
MSMNEQIIQKLKADSALTCEGCGTVMTVEQPRLRLAIKDVKTCDTETHPVCRKCSTDPDVVPGDSMIMEIAPGVRLWMQGEG